jgi:DNA polymerase-3 subunit gamma/tau
MVERREKEGSMTEQLAIYRRYRASTFGELRGQDPIAKTLRRAVVDGRLGHGLLFVGPRGTGKTSTARIVAKALNCLAPTEGEPCGTCRSCRAITEGATFDVVESNAATSNRIDDVRDDLIPLITNPPTDLKRKVLILDEVHRFTNDAWDALLKWLEEPPPGIVFIFCTTDPSKIRPAVLSRLQRFDFRPIARAEIAAKLTSILAAEKRVAEPAAIELLARLADGGMRDAESMLDQLLSSGADPLTVAEVEELLGLPGADRIERLACAILDADAPAGLAILAEFEARGRDPRVVADRLTDLVRRGLHAALAGGGTVPGDAGKLPAGLDLSDGGGATIGLAGRTREALLGLANALRRIDTARGDADLRLGLELLLLGGGEALAAPTAPRPVAPKSAPAHVAPTTTAPAASRTPTPTRPTVASPDPAAAPVSSAPPPATAEWGNMLASADPATKPLLADARPTLSGDTLVLRYPPTKSFLRQRAEAKRERIEALADKAYGRKIIIQFGELDADAALREVWTE